MTQLAPTERPSDDVEKHLYGGVPPVGVTACEYGVFSMPLGKVREARANGDGTTTGETTTVSDPATCADAASVTLAARNTVCAPTGVPETVQFEFMVSPSEDADKHVYGGFPPVIPMF